MGRTTHSFNRMMSASTLNIWYSPEASFTRRMMELVSCVMGCSVDGQAMPWCRFSRSRWTARTEMARGRKGQDFILVHWREVRPGEQWQGELCVKGQMTNVLSSQSPTARDQLIPLLVSGKVWVGVDLGLSGPPLLEAICTWKFPCQLPSFTLGASNPNTELSTSPFLSRAQWTLRLLLSFSAQIYLSLSCPEIFCRKQWLPEPAARWFSLHPGLFYPVVEWPNTDTCSSKVNQTPSAMRMCHNQVFIRREPWWASVLGLWLPGGDGWPS